MSYGFDATRHCPLRYIGTAHQARDGPRSPFRKRRGRLSKDIAFEVIGYLFEKRSISDCLGYGSESVGSGLAGGVAAAVAAGAGGAP
jgi:hypothetical protein